MTTEVETREANRCCEIKTFTRNRYFYGKLLDVQQFELEQDYFNDKRRLLNRLVCGWGVVCGLPVGLTDDMKGVWVGPGVALDKCGREIVVPVQSQPVLIPLPEPAGPVRNERSRNDEDNDGDNDQWDDGHIASLWICYGECPSDPVPLPATDCEQAPVCSDGSVRERYTLEIRPYRAPEIHMLCELPDLITGGKVNYKAVAIYVTNSDCNAEADCCIPLANISLPYGGKTTCEEDIDITVRPIVYTNDLLFELMLGLTAHVQNRTKGGKA